MTIKKIGIAGYGTMGSGIAVAALLKGFFVKILEKSEANIAVGNRNLDASITRLIEKNKTALSLAELRKNLRTVLDVGEMQDSDVVVEAITEDLGMKRELLQKLDGVLPPSVVIASNTSSISITQLAKFTGRPDRILGMHFMNPVPLMQLVEVIPSAKTSPAVLEMVSGLVKALDKTPVIVKDSPGFAVNRLLIPMINEAAFMVMDNISSPEEIDLAMKLGANHPIGPLALSDLIGNDVVLAIMKILYADFNDEKYRPCPLLAEMVAAGRLGRKSKHGFYAYSK